MFDHRQFRQAIIQPALYAIGLYSPSAEELLIATCAIESHGGTYLLQSGAGVAKGLYQMEPATHDDLCHRVLTQHPDLKKRILEGCLYVQLPSADALVSNLFYATMMARLLYFARTSQMLPYATDIEGLWQLYKQYWNTEKGLATRAKFLSAYYHFVGGHHPVKNKEQI